jgi:hypothetical protein
VTLADHLAQWPRDRLERLLRLRPDLRAAGSIGELARMATSPNSTHAALKDLPALQRHVLEATVLLGPDARSDDLVALDPDADAGAVLAALDDLRDRLLVVDDGLRPIGMVRQGLPSPLGLGRPLEQIHEATPLYELERLLALYGERAPRTKAAARALLAQVLSDTEALAASLVGMPPQQLEVLRRYDAEGPVLREPGLNVWEGQPPKDPAVTALLGVGLLAVTPSGTVELPLEIGLALRYPAVTRFPLAPLADGRRVTDGELAPAAAAAVTQLLALADGIVALVGRKPVALLASGGVGVKELRALATQLAVEPPAVATVLVLLRTAGVLAVTTKDLRLTSAEREWSGQCDAVRWEGLVRAWLSLTDPPPAAAGSGRRLTAALSYSAYDARARPGRQQLLRLLDDSACRCLDPVGWLDRWHARWPAERRTANDRGGMLPARELRADLLAEAEVLGLLVDGAPSPLVDPLLSHADLDAALTALAGAGETRIRAQADMTLVCTGRPIRELQRALDRIADVEASGHATVWRLSEQSLTRAYDEGDAPDGVVALLERHAGELPQAMSYLVHDAHRRHGRARVGAATAYVVVDDDALLATALSSKGAAGKALTKLGVRRIAPGVAVSRGSVEATVAALRTAGVPAVPERSAGDAHATSTVRRAPAPALRELPPPPARDDLASVAAAVDRILGGG